MGGPPVRISLQHYMNPGVLAQIFQHDLFTTKCLRTIVFLRSSSSHGFRAVTFPPVNFFHFLPLFTASTQTFLPILVLCLLLPLPHRAEGYKQRILLVLKSRKSSSFSWCCSSSAQSFTFCSLCYSRNTIGIVLVIPTSERLSILVTSLNAACFLNHASLM